ncbi:hypothetical protein [Stutzerimonas nitrititolerans]|uniref:hypothetical protein n=1 Tax=Stutzerimonas nitrititolerans TaxID=2482751 RepID=UPI002898E341|nr:hypothetical protein [Stutzerimonas nitrititolerans]
MSKVLVDREEIEAVRNTLANGGGAVGVLRWAESVLAAQPAEAEGVKRWNGLKLAAEVAEEDGPWEPRLGMTDCETAFAQSASPSKVLELIASLSAVTAERDRLREVVNTANGFQDALERQRDQLRAEVEALRKDAERWRYVSLQGDDTHWLNLLRVDLEDFGGNINAAVDALIDGDTPAMAAKEA